MSLLSQKLKNNTESYLLRKELSKEANLLVQLELNIPIELYDDQRTKKALKKIDNSIQSLSPLKTVKIESGYFYDFSNTTHNKLKHKMLKIEQDHEIGRLIDLDVYLNNKKVSRKELNYDQRKCFLCEKEHWECIENKTHSRLEIIEFCKNKIEDFTNAR